MWVVSIIASVCSGVDIRQDGLSAVLRDDGSQLVRIGVHADGAQRGPLRGRLSRRRVGAVQNPEAGADGVRSGLAFMSRRRHSHLPLRHDGVPNRLFITSGG